MNPFKKKCCDPYKTKKCSKKLIKLIPSIKAKLQKMNIESLNSVICSSCQIKVSTNQPISMITSPEQAEDSLTLINQGDLDSMSTSEQAGSPVICQEGSDDMSDSMLTSSQSEAESDTDYHDSEVDRKDVIQVLNNKLLPILNLSPISLKNLSVKYVTKKIREVTMGLKKKLCNGYECLLDEDESKAKDFDQLITKLKIKFSEADNKKEKYRILTLLPKSWSVAKIQTEFNCTRYMARSAKKLHESSGVLSVPAPKLPSNKLDRKITDLINNFYLQDDVSRMMPGKNDCVSMMVEGKFRFILEILAFYRNVCTYKDVLDSDRTELFD